MPAWISRRKRYVLNVILHWHLVGGSPEPRRTASSDLTD
jgi:hypothetical protein